MIRPVLIVVLATLKLASPLLATRTSSALMSNALKPAIVVFPAADSVPSNLTLSALIAKSLPEASVGVSKTAPWVFLSVKVRAVMVLAAALAGAVVSPLAKCPAIPAALMVKSSWLLPKLTEPKVSTLL